MNAHHKIAAAVIAATIAVTPTTMHAATTNVTLSNVAATNSLANGNGHMADYGVTGHQLFIANGACKPHAGAAILTWDTVFGIELSTGNIDQGGCILPVTYK